MADNNNDDEQLQAEFSLAKSRRAKRLFSQIPLPSTGIILRQLPGSNVTVAYARKRRTVSEQVNRHDR